MCALVEVERLQKEFEDIKNKKLPQEGQPADKTRVYTSQQDIWDEQMMAQYKAYQKMKEDGLFPVIDPKHPITKGRKPVEVDRSYELCQYIHPVFNYVNPATANINIPIDENGDYLEEPFEITSGKTKEGTINIDRHILNSGQNLT
jgi:hypothetical protein